MKFPCLIVVAVFIFSLLSANVIAGEESGVRFQSVKNVGVLDTQTGLMWAEKDNGKDINWEDAKAYCENYSFGNYSDWRLATQDELKTLFQPDSVNSMGYKITERIELTGCCPWASDWSMRSAGAFSFKSGRRPWAFQDDSSQLRALPVRDTHLKAEHGSMPAMRRE